MNFRFLAQAAPSLDPQLQWLLYSERTASFITGDARRAFAIATAAPNQLAPLGPEADPDRPFHPSNLPISVGLADEPSLRAWHGFQFLERADYDHAVGADGLPAGDQLRTLVFGPDYGHYVLHPASGAILALRSGSIELLRRTPGGFERVERTRTRGRAALAFAGHPHEPLVVYGDNAGDFHLQRFSADGFGRAGKIAARQRKASRLAWAADGARLLLGGMGYLAALAFEGGKLRPLHEAAMAVRDFVLLDDGALLVNQGMHGLAAYRCDEAGFARTGGLGAPIREIVVSTCRRYLATLAQDGTGVCVYEMSAD